MINPDKYKKHFRRISHPRRNLQYDQDSIDYLNSKNRIVPNVSPYAVFMELSNYYDPYDTGLDIGSKEIRHSEKIAVFNKIFFNWQKKPLGIETNRFERRSWRQYCQYKNKKINDKKFNVDKVYDHITKQKLIYGTMNPFSPIRVLGTDVDNSTANPELVLPFLYLFQLLYPKSFHDKGSSGKSLHYYPKIEMLLLYEYYLKNTNITCEWATYANDIIKHTGRIFKIYGHNILCPEHTLAIKMLKSGKTKFVPEYLVEFDSGFNS